MTLKRVKNYDLFATGDACIFSMAGEPQFMYADLTPSKHYIGYIKHVDNMHHEYQVVITNDIGKPITVGGHADPVRMPIGLPLYIMLEVLLDKKTYFDRLQSREKKDLKYAQQRYEEAVTKAAARQVKGRADWDKLEEH